LTTRYAVSSIRRHGKHRARALPDAPKNDIERKQEVRGASRRKKRFAIWLVSLAVFLFVGRRREWFSGKRPCGVDGGFMTQAVLAPWIWTSQETPRRQRWFLLAFAAAIALASHAVFILFLPAPWQPSQGSDFRVFYEPVALQLADGRGFHLPSGKPALQYPPGVPIVYAATFWLADRAGFSHEAGEAALQALLTILSGVLVAALALKCYGARVALLACVLWSTYPFHLWLTKQPSGEPLVCVLLLFAILAFIQWSASGRGALLWGCICGVVLGFAALTKPFTLALPAVFFVLAWVCNVPCTRIRRAVFSLAILAAFVLALSPWEVLAWRATGQIIPLCTNGPASAADGLTFSRLRKKAGPRQQLPTKVAALADDLAAHRKELRSSGGIARLLLTKVKQEPIEVASLFLTKAVQSWYSNDSHTHEHWTALVQFFYLPLFGMGAWLARSRDRQEKNFLLIAAGVTLYYWAMTTFAALAIMRYMVPAISLLMVLAGDATDAFLRALAWWADRASRYGTVYAVDQGSVRR
jgi:4-amino-4-deoxy-L-arabinose transferase-like glycosyltransferase